MTDEDFIFSAKDLITHLDAHSKMNVRALPKIALMCLSPSVAVQLSKGQTWRTESAFGAKWTFVSDSLVLASGFGIGAPAASAKLEEMKSLGVESVVFLGTAGALHSDLGIGDVVLVQTAHSAEGTSKHYSSQVEFHGNDALIKEVGKLLKNKNIEFKIGATWSTDAPYRERRSELTRLQNRGVMCVDMEASALYAVAESLNVRALGVFVISDGLSGGKWKPAFGQGTLREKFSNVAVVLMQAMSRWKT